MGSNTTTKNSLQIAFWNTNGLQSARNELAEFVERHDIDAILLCETRLRQNIRDPRIPGFTLYRTDRQTGPGGGTAIYVRNHIPHFVMATPNTQNLEATGITVTTPRGPLKLFACYNRPRHTLLDADLHSLLDGNTPVIAAGDFNAKHLNWNSRNSNRNGIILDDFTDRFNAVVMVPALPTYHNYATGVPDFLDVAVVKNVVHQIDLVTIDELSSDHSPVLISLGDIPHEPELMTHATVNWERFTESISENFGPLLQIHTTEDLEEAVMHFETSIKDAQAVATRHRVEPRKRHTIPREIVDLIRAKNRARRIARRSGFAPDKREANRLQNEVKRALFDFRNQQWDQKIESLNENDKPLWRMTKALRADRRPLPPIHGSRGLVFTDEEKADAFADSLELQCRANEVDVDGFDDVERIENRVADLLEEVPENPISPTSPAEICEVIKGLKARKAPGPDGITHKALKSLPDKAIVALVNITNAIFRLRTFPARWKCATVIFIPKPGKDPKFPQNHRPISLLSAPGKVVERIFRARLADFANDNGVLPDEQFGFRPSHSSADQLLRLSEFVSVSRSWNKMCTAVIFLDVAKAFDSVWHDGLVHKFSAAGFPTAQIQLLASFLRDRSFRAKTGNALSGPRPIEAGVPQGSALSPLLYAVFTADIPRTPFTTLAMYADDTAIIARSHQARLATQRLQVAADQLEDWFTNSRISVNPEKSSALLISTSTKPSKCQPTGHVRMFDQDIPWKDQVKYLGVILDKRLSFIKHVDYALSKGKMAAARLYPLTCRKSKLSIRNKLKLYKSIIRPMMTYASPAWSHVSDHQIHRLQVFQNKLLRQIFNAPWYVRNSQLHREANLPTLKKFLREIAIPTFEKAAQHSNPLIRQAVDYDERAPLRYRRPKSILVDK